MNSLGKKFFKDSTKQKKMNEDEEVQVLMELDDSNIQFLPEESKQLKYLVFRIANTIGDESIALANMAVMFRGEPTSMVDVLNIYLGLKSLEDDSVARLGTAIPDDDDLRVCRILDWTNSVPLPLGKNLLDRLRIIIHIDGHVDPSRVKFGADLIPFPEVFLEGNPKMKRRMGSSVVRFQGGELTQIENPVSALSLDENTTTKAVVPSVPSNGNQHQLQQNLHLQNIIVSLLKQHEQQVEHWWDPPMNAQKVMKPREFL